MEGTQRRDLRSRLRWALGSLMVVVAVTAVVVAVLRPFVMQAPPSEEVIGINFDFRETRTADGQRVMGLVPSTTITKQAVDKGWSAKPGPGRTPVR